MEPLYQLSLTMLLYRIKLLNNSLIILFKVLVLVYFHTFQGIIVKKPLWTPSLVLLGHICQMEQMKMARWWASLQEAKRIVSTVPEVLYVTMPLLALILAALVSTPHQETPFVKDVCQGTKFHQLFCILLHIFIIFVLFNNF